MSSEVDANVDEPPTPAPIPVRIPLSIRAPPVAVARRFGAFRMVLRLAFRRVVAIYFREVEVAGDVPDPQTSGRLFGANHVNALVDPILVLTQAPCPISPVAKSTLWKIPGLRWLLDAADAVPIVRRRDNPEKTEKDNEAVFERVASHLATGGNILIFPEGTSHNEPHLIALRSGAGRMLARAQRDASGLTYQAVALEFDARDVFRSRSLVLFGPVRHADGEGGDVATRITEQLRADLSELLVEGATWDERIALVRVAEMFANEQAARSLSELNLLGRRIEEARRTLGAAAPDVVADIELRVSRYFRALEDEGATDALVARFARRAAESADGAASLPTDPRRVARAALMVLTLPLAVCGMLLYCLPYQLPRAVTHRLKDDADTSSTYKLGVGLVVHPLWATLAIALAYAELPRPLFLAASLLVLTSPFAALPWLDRWDRLAARLRLLSPGEDRRERFVELARTRTALLADLVRLS